MAPHGRLTLDEVLNLEHPTGETCQCPECEHHQPGSCDGHRCQEPGIPTDCGCRQPRHSPPDFHIEQVGQYAVAWPATHRANVILEQEHPPDIHHGGDRLVTDQNMPYLVNYLNGQNANAAYWSQPAPA